MLARVGSRRRREGRGQCRERALRAPFDTELIERYALPRIAAAVSEGHVKRVGLACLSVYFGDARGVEVLGLWPPRPHLVV
jgi:hypothetical protein